MSLDPGIPPEFFSPKQNPWGMVGGAVIASLASLMVKRVRLAVLRWWRTPGTKAALAQLTTQMTKLAEQNGVLTEQNAGLLQRLVSITETVHRIEHEFYPNSGGSFCDRMVRENAITWRMLERYFTEGVFVTDAEGNVTYTNSHLQRWLGKRGVELAGRGLGACIATSEQARFRAEFDDCISNGIEYRALLNMRFLSAAGTAHKVLTAWKVTPVRHPESDAVIALEGEIRPATDMDRTDIDIQRAATAAIDED